MEHIAPQRPWHFRQRGHTLFSSHPEPEPAVCDCLCLYFAYFEEGHGERSVSQLRSGSDFFKNISNFFFFFFIFFPSFSSATPFFQSLFSRSSVQFFLCVYLTELSFNCHSVNQSFKCHLTFHISDHSVMWRKFTALCWPVPTLFFPLFTWQHYESSPILLWTDTPIPRNTVCHTSQSETKPKTNVNFHLFISVQIQKTQRGKKAGFIVNIGNRWVCNNNENTNT